MPQKYTDMQQAITQLKDKKIFFLDRDGTLTIGSQKIPGAQEFIQHLMDNDIAFYVTTNNSSKTPQQHSEGFHKKGLAIDPQNVLVSSEAAIEYLKQEGITELYLLANTDVLQFFESHGIFHTNKNPKAILLTYDTELNYTKLTEIVELINAGVPYFATHADLVCPVEGGSLPDVGLYIHMLEVSTGVSPSKIFGKPDPNFVAGILKKHGLDFSDAVVVGDRLYTDVLMGANSDITSVLVLTGETTQEDYDKSEIRADIVVENLPLLLPLR